MAISHSGGASRPLSLRIVTVLVALLGLYLASSIAHAQPFAPDLTTCTYSSALGNNGQGWAGVPNYCSIIVGWNNNTSVSTGASLTFYPNVFFTGSGWSSYVRYLQYSVDGGARTNIFWNPSGGWGGWEYEQNEQRCWHLTITALTGNHTITFYAANGYTGSEAVTSLSYTGAPVGSPPTVTLAYPPSSPFYVNEWVIARATGNDPDGNLGGVALQYSVGGGDWQTLAWDASGAGEGSQKTTNYNSFQAPMPGVSIQFRCYAWDGMGYDSGWQYSGYYYTTNRAPNSASISASGANVTWNSTYGHYMMNLGGAVTLSASLSDPDGNLSTHYIKQDMTAGTLTDIMLTDGQSGRPNNVATGGSSSSKIVTTTPQLSGRYSFNSNGLDVFNATASSSSVTVWVYGATNNAQFLTQTVNGSVDPTSITVNNNQSFNVGISMRNNGDKLWDRADANPHRLGAVNDVSTWGLNRVDLASPSTVVYSYPGAGSDYTFNFTAVAPNVPGVYSFQWRMLEEGLQSFGAATNNVQITVLDTVAPTAPTNLQQSGSTFASISLSWSASSDNSGTVSGYRIYRNGQLLGTSTTTSFTDSGLSGNSSYQYYVTAYDAKPNYSSSSNTITATTVPVSSADANQNGIVDGQEQITEIAPPYFTSFEPGTGFSAGNINNQGAWFAGPTMVSITTTAAADGTMAVSLPGATPTTSLVKYFTPISGQPITYVDFFIKPVFTETLNASSYVDLTSAQVGFLTESESGRFQVLTTDAQGLVQWLPVGPAITLNSSRQAQTWQRMTFRLNYTTRLWDLFLNGQAIASGLRLNSVHTFFPSFLLFGGTPATTWFDDIYVGSASPLPPDTVQPSQPQNVTIVYTSSSSVSLYWSASTSAIGVQNYNIYRNGTLIGTVSGQKTYFTDAGLSAGTSYTYTISAVSTGGVASSQSSGTVATTSSTASTPSLEIFSPLR